VRRVLRRVSVMMSPWVLFVIIALGVSACGSDYEDSSDAITVSPQVPRAGGPAAAIGRACGEHEGVLTVVGRDEDGYTLDWIVVCRDQTLRVVDVY
jgi:hypothetical protein